MTAELGHFALILAFAISAMMALSAFGKRFIPAQHLVLFVEKATLAQFFLISFAFAMLIKGFAYSDFSLLHVTLNSHSLKPIFYKIAASWGNHEGSLLLWVFVLSLSGMLLSLKRSQGMRDVFRLYLLSVQAGIAVFFLAFILFLSNPFARLFPIPLEGEGLNPLLQDPGLVIHPPLLYIGYVGLSIGFSFAVALLLDPKAGVKVIGWMRPWVMFAWLFLTAGIAAGSHWAYRELGWGGFWFWDPVENLSLIPWLIATALLHSAIISEKRKALHRWTLLLAIFGFSSSLLGTFLVRSGLLTSVHAFSSDPARGVFILMILVFTTGFALLLFALRAHLLEEGSVFRPLSREAALVFNNMLLCSAAATVLLGTSYPIFLSVLGLEGISVGTPYYLSTFLPLAALLGLGMGVGPFIAWKGYRNKNRKAFFLFPFMVLGGFLGLAFLFQWKNFIAGFGLGFGFWLCAMVVMEIFEKLKRPVFSWSILIKNMRILPISVWSMSSAHFGIAVLVIGITSASALGKEKTVTMMPGDEVRLGAYHFVFRGLEKKQGRNYNSLVGHVSLYFKEKETLLRPERRFYASGGNETTEASIYNRFFSDIYVVMGRNSTEEEVIMRFYIKPWIDFIWIGAGFMVLGGILSFFGARRPSQPRAHFGARRPSQPRARFGARRPSQPRA